MQMMENQRTILAAKPSITEKEIAYVKDAVEFGWGADCYSYLNKFKAELVHYFGVKAAWPTSSCHGALHIALMALGVGPGDEVIVPDITWAGTVVPVSWLGAKPIFADVEGDNWCIDPVSIEQKISAKTKAIIVVHLYGNLVDMDAVMAIANKYSIPVIEDAAEAVGSMYKGKKAGAIGDIGVFSMHGTKTITAGEGGAILTQREDLIESISIIEGQGRKPSKHILYWVDAIGLKYKMSNIQAALGLAQLERINELVESKRKIFNQYASVFKAYDEIQMNVERQGDVNSYWLPTLQFKGKFREIDRDQMVTDLNKKGIGIRPFFYPVSMFPMYESTLENSRAYDMFKHGINVPSYYDMTEEDVSYVAAQVISYLREKCE